MPITTVTTMQAFLRCRRAWWLQSPTGLGLEPDRPPALALSFGTAVHAGLEANARGEDWRRALDEVLVHQRQEVYEAYYNKVGAPMAPEEALKLKDSEKLAVSVLEHYFERYSEDHPLGQTWEYIQPEVGFEIPLDYLGEAAEGWLLRGSIDGLAEHKKTGAIGGVEHKTYSQKTNEAALQMDDQLTGYFFAVWKLFGVFPESFLYDGIAKKLPIEPRLLQSGKLSKEWIDTTEGVYRRTLAKHGLDAADYADILARLAARDKEPQTPFFTRYRIYVPEHSVRLWERNLYWRIRDMDEVVFTNGETAYPNVPWTGCWDCGVQDLCKAIQFDEDVHGIISQFYRENHVGHASYTREASRPGEVTLRRKNP